MEGKRGPGPIPNRWLNCPRKSADLVVDKFIAFKTPLSEKFDEQVPVECRFSPKMIFQFARSKKVQIGLWIDLTNTSRFYNRQSVEEENCKYLKLACRGHGETPSIEQTKMFTNLCHTFINNNPLKVIAVHCTHGFNRTGFLIVSYLVDCMDFGIDVALSEYSRNRPPGIYKQDYLDELYKRYGDEVDTPPAPPLPAWCNEEENEADRDENADTSFADVSDDNVGGSSKRPVRNRNAKMPVFMTGIKGVTPVLEQPKAYNIQRKVQAMCNWKSSKGFPGCQPVSMDCQNMHLLQQKPYRVSWKADGTRYMLLIDGEDELYFLDRDNNVFHVKGVRFPYRKDFNRHLVKTLVDGEMVIDKVNGEDIPRYLIYDIIKFEGQDVNLAPFYPVRLRCINDELITPRFTAIADGRLNKILEPFSIRKKDFWDVTAANSLLGDKFAATLSHEPDGLIFQPSKEPYVAGRCDEVLKWKPLDMNSVDFRLRVKREKREGLIQSKVGNLYVGGMDEPFAKMRWTKALAELDNKIIECKFENNAWVFMRERVDKSFPNSYNTAAAVYASIKVPVTKEKLLDFIQFHRFIDETEQMPPPPKRMKR